MGEIKNTFNRGIMNKDLDERLIPNGQFRDAMNVQVSTSEGSDVGTAQNILGNIRAEDIISNYSSSSGIDLMCVGAVADEKNDVLYWFVSSGTVDAILEYRDDGTVTPILVDRNSNVLQFDVLNIITGINIVDNLLFWTDNVNEPKKINIDTLKLNNHTDLLTHSDMFVKGVSVGEITLDNITVIRKRPQRAPVVLFDNVAYEPITPLIEFNFYDMGVATEFQFDDGPWRFSQITPTNLPGDFIWPYEVGDEFVLSLDSEPGSLPHNYQIKIEVIGQTLVLNSDGPPVEGLGGWNGATWTSVVWDLKIVEIDRIYDNELLLFNATKIPETEPIFERELIRFATRWKYVDGEYSAYSPFTVPIFLAGQFYFHPTDDPFNQGMESRATSLTIKDFIREDTPNDVVQVDILFKKEKSTTIYSIDSVKIDDTFPSTTLWDEYDTNKDGVYITDSHQLGLPVTQVQSLISSDRGKSGLYKVTTENIYAALPDNQMLRPWDNVPRKALSQEITANRVVYGNYLQNYDLKNTLNDIVTPWIVADWEYRDYLRVGGGNSPALPVTFVNNRAEKSIKSLRTYYLGIVYGDEYGRETPVLTSKEASIKIPFDWDDTAEFDGAADDSTRLIAKLVGEQPSWARYFKYFIKQTTGEYYNLTLDRVYKAAGDENLWVSFPSSDRNKIEIGDYFSIKKQVDIEQIVPVENKIKIIDIKNEAPESIKFDYVSLGSAGGSQAILDALFIDLSAQPAKGVKRLLIDKSTWVDTENGLALEDLNESDKLAIQFTIVEGGNNIKSEKYFVTGFSVEDNGGDLQYNIVLRKVIQEADGWVESSIGVLNHDKGLTVTIYKLEDKNPVEFEGRFFVKIISNPVTQTYLVPSTTDIYAFQVLGVLEMFHLVDSHGDFATNTLGIFNTINSWAGNNTGNDLSGLTGFPNNTDWDVNAAFDTGVNNTGGWFLDNTTFVAAQHGTNLDVRYSGRMYKGDLYNGVDASGTISGSGPGEGQEQYVNGLEGLISPLLSGPASVPGTFTLQPPYDHDPSGPNSLGGARRWSSEVIDLMEGTIGWPYGVTSAGNAIAPRYEVVLPPATEWDNTYDCVEDGGHWIHLSYLAPGVDLHNGNFGVKSTGNFDKGGTNSFSGDASEWLTMMFGYLDRIRATSIYRDGIDTQTDGNWLFPSVPCNGCSYNALTAAQKEDNENQWNPAYPSNPGAQSVIDRLIPGSRFMIVGDDVTVYTIKRRHEKRLYNHTAWNPSPRIDENGTILGYDWNGGNPIMGNDSVAHYTQAVMDFCNVGGILGGNALTNSDEFRDWKRAVVNFGKANNRRVCYILQVDKDTTGSQISWDDDDDANTINVVNNFPDTADNDTAQVIRFVDDYIEPGANTLPTSPAIFETEADEDVDLNIYYEASDALPIGLDGNKGHLLAPIGTKVSCSVNNSLVNYSSANSLWPDYDLFLKVKSWDGNELELFGPGLITNPGGQALATSNDALGWSDQSTIYGTHYVWFWREDGSYTTAVIDRVSEISTTGPDFYVTKLIIRNNSHQEKVGLPYYNCFSFGNGVESNRVRDDFNESYILNGVKASTVLEEPYEEERRRHGLIYSGIYNTISGVNNLNQFIAAEKITKDLMPSYGSIQKLYARDKDLITLCEDKIIRIYVDKDILYNADGNTQLLATNKVLGTAEPFRGNYGISKNPESFAAESFRVYFTDKQRGAVLRLSMDGLTPISDAGMHDYFRDNLPLNKVLLGSYDAHKGNYNLTMFKNLYRDDFSRGIAGARSLYYPTSAGCDDKTAVTGGNGDTVVLQLHQHPFEASDWVGYFNGLTSAQAQVPFQDYWYARMYTERQGHCDDCGYNCGNSSTNTWECSDGACADTGAGVYTEAQCLNQFCGSGPSTGRPPTIPPTSPSLGAYPVFEDTVSLSDFGQEEQIRANSSDSRQYQAPLEDSSFPRAAVERVAIGRTCCKIPVHLIDITLEVTYDIHVNTGMPVGTVVWSSWQELMDWRDTQNVNWGVSTEVIENVISAYSIFNEELCACSYEDIIGCTNSNALNYDPDATTACIDCCEYPSYAETITYNEGVKGWVSFKSFLPEFAISSVNQYYTMKQGMLWKHHQETTPESRNTFYNTFEESSITPVLNTQPDVVKNFNTLNYEGSQTKVDIHLTDNDYYNLYEKRGWYVEDIHTDLEDGTLNEFIEKEGKWFNYIKGSCKELDTAAFNFQGLGVTNLVAGECLPCATATIVGCTDPNATNYDASATVDDGSCTYTAAPGCTDPLATNYDPNATVDDGSCTYPSVIEGCTDPLASNYDPSAAVDDGSCTYAPSIDCITQPITWTWDGTNLTIDSTAFDPAVLFPNAFSTSTPPLPVHTQIFRSDGTEVEWIAPNPASPVTAAGLTMTSSWTWSNPFSNITPGNYTAVLTVYDFNVLSGIILSQCSVAITIV